MSKNLPNVIYGSLAACLVLGLLLSSSKGDALRVEYDKSLLKVQNVSSAPVRIHRIVVNDRPECFALDVTPKPNPLPVGDSRLLLSQCEVVRVTISTENGDLTYTF